MRWKTKRPQLPRSGGQGDFPAWGMCRRGLQSRRANEEGDTSPLETFAPESTLAERCMPIRKNPESGENWAQARWLARDSPENCPHISKLNRPYCVQLSPFGVSRHLRLIVKDWLIIAMHCKNFRRKGESFMDHLFCVWQFSVISF